MRYDKRNIGVMSQGGIAMKKIVVLGLVVVLLVLGATVVSAGARGPIVHSVHVGGPDVCDAWGVQPGCDSNFALTALKFADGTVIGQWDDRWGTGDGGGHFVVDCLEVGTWTSNGTEYKSAWISGVVKTPKEAAGWPVSTWVVDTDDPTASDGIGGTWWVPAEYHDCHEQATEADGWWISFVPQGVVIID
jgi:hypothetical protein